VAVATTLAMPAILGAQDKSGSKRPRVGAGEFVYECEHDWAMGSLPQDHQYGNASHGVTIDRAGLIYISHHGNPGSIFVFEPSGKFVRAMGEQLRVGTGPDQGRGHGIDLRVEGNEEFLYLSPNDASLPFIKMSLRGEIVWQRGRKELSADSGFYDDPKTPYRPTNASFRPDGGYYLGDGYGSNVIFHYDRNDKFVKVIGGKGTADGKFETPHGQWLDARDGTPKLVVADRANKRLQWFDMQDNHLQTLDGFLFPAAIDQQGDLLLVPDLHARVTLLNKANQPVAQLGDDPQWRERVLAGNNAMRAKRESWLPGKFVHPHDACFDAAGNIYVVEWVKTGRVTKLTKVS
jgi:hypothetical protein